MAKNKVLAGRHKDRDIVYGGFGLNTIEVAGERIYKGNVESYVVIDEDIRKSAVSGVARAGVGVALLGPIGLLAGLSAKNKGTYTVAITWYGGEQSLIEIDKRMYKILVEEMF